MYFLPVYVPIYLPKSVCTSLRLRSDSGTGRLELDPSTFYVFCSDLNDDIHLSFLFLLGVEGGIPNGNGMGWKLGYGIWKAWFGIWDC